MAKEYVYESDIKTKEKQFKRSELSTILVILAVILYVGLSLGMIAGIYPSIGLSGVFLKFIKNPVYIFQHGYIGPELNNIYTILTVCIFITVAAFQLLGYTIRKMRLHNNLETLKGSAIWADINYLLNKYTDWDEKRKSYRNVFSNYILSNNFFVGIKTCMKAINVLILGYTGSGKSRGVVKPNMMQLNSCYVITDPSGGTMADEGEFMRRNGYDIKCFDIKNMGHCNTYNPLRYCYKESDIRRLTTTLVKALQPEAEQSNSSKDPFWDDAMFALMCGEIALLTTIPDGSDVPYAQIPEIMGGKLYLPALSNIGELTRIANRKWDPRTSAVKPFKGAHAGDSQNNTANASELALIFENLRKWEAERQGCEPAYIEEPFALKQWNDFKIAPEKTSTTVLMTVNTKMSMFNIKEVRDLTNSDTIHLEDFGTNKVCLFMALPTGDPTYNFLASCLYTQLFDILYKKGDNKMKGSHFLETPKGDFIKWFEPGEDYSAYLESIKNCTYEKCGFSIKEGVEIIKKGKKKIEQKVKFDDSWYDIYTSDHVFITRKQRLSDAQEFINGCKRAKVKTPRDVDLPLRTRFVLDEFATTTQIPDFLEKLATVRKYNIGCDIFVQDFVQLKNKYKDDWETFDSNCPFTVDLGSSGVTTNEYLVKKIGQATKRTEQNSIGGGNKNISGSYQTDGRDLIQAAEIGRLEDDEQLILIIGEQPLKDKKYEITKHPNYKLTPEYCRRIGVDACVFDDSCYEDIHYDVIIRASSEDTPNTDTSEGFDRAFTERLGKPHFPSVKKITLPDSKEEFEKLFGVQLETTAFVDSSTSEPTSI